jgi:antitoxin ParD1/3/4
MNVNVTPELEAFVNEKVKSGLYNSASEVIRESLRLLKEQDDLKKLRLAELRREIAVGLNDLSEGRKVALTPETVADIKARGRRPVAGYHRQG